MDPGMLHSRTASTSTTRRRRRCGCCTWQPPCRAMRARWVTDCAPSSSSTRRAATPTTVRVLQDRRQLGCTRAMLLRLQHRHVKLQAPSFVGQTPCCVLSFAMPIPHPCHAGVEAGALRAQAGVDGRLTRSTSWKARRRRCLRCSWCGSRSAKTALSSRTPWTRWKRPSTLVRSTWLSTSRVKLGHGRPQCPMTFTLQACDGT